MFSLDPTLTQPRHHAVDVLFGYAERNVVLRRAAVDQRVDAKKSKHPALPRLGIKQKSTRPIAPAKAELESELVNVELDCAIKVNHRKVHLVQPAMKMVARSESVQGLTSTSSAAASESAAGNLWWYFNHDKGGNKPARRRLQRLP